MAASDWAYLDQEQNAYGYWTEDGVWHPLDRDARDLERNDV